MWASSEVDVTEVLTMEIDLERSFELALIEAVQMDGLQDPISLAYLYAGEVDVLSRRAPQAEDAEWRMNSSTASRDSSGCSRSSRR